MKKSFLSSIILATFIPFTLLLVSCQEDNPAKQMNILGPIDGTLTGKKIPISEFIYRPRKIHLADDMIMVYDDVDSNMFKFFSYPELEYLFSWGAKGDGPDEIGFINDNGQIQISGDTMTFLDLYELKTYKIARNRKFELLKKTMLTPTEGFLNGFHMLNDSSFFAYQESNLNKEFIFIYPNEKKGLSFGEYPDDGLEFQFSFNKAIYYQKYIAINQEQEKIAALYKKRGLVRIYDFSGNLLSEKDYRKKSINSSKEDIYWREFRGVFSTERYIYALYFGNDLKDYEVAPRSLVVLNWEGEILRRYEMDLNSCVDIFVVSEKHNKISGLTLEGGQHIIEFDLPEIE